MKSHPWLYPISRRIGTTIVCICWVVFELVVSDEQGIWFWLALGATAYAIWSFFLSGEYKGDPPTDES